MWGSSNAEALGDVKYSFIGIVPMSTLSWSGSTWKGSINGSNRTVWHLNWVQTKDMLNWIVKIELFDDLTVCKPMTDIWLNC